MGPTIDDLIMALIAAACTVAACFLSNDLLQKWFARAHQRLRAPPAHHPLVISKTADPATYFCPACGCQLVFIASYGKHPNSKLLRLWCEVCKTGVDKPIIKLKKGEKSHDSTNKPS